MPSLLNKAWKIKTPHSDSSLISRVCAHRELKLESELSELHSPWALKDIDKAVARLERALKDQERIMIFGDYDVDGVTGASILYLGLKDLGALVSVRLPHREKDGYGLNTRVLDECKQLGVPIVITVDCGISNVKEVEYGKELGLDIIITDHHAIPPQLPKAFAILNPKQVDCQYPEKNICGAVVAFKLLMALSERIKSTVADLSDTFLDMAALATVADCMPLTGENRLIVKRGLLQFQQTKHRGLRTLLQSYNLINNPKLQTTNYELRTPTINSYDLGFKIAPCINAAGRLEDPMIAFKMMMGDEETALQLRGINEERQEVVKSALEEASAQVERDHLNDPILIFWGETWQPGIIGLLAGKICEKYHKPVICLTRHEHKYVGSCRSIPEINIVETLQRHEDLFLNYGGHAQAAGLSIAPQRLDELRQRLIAEVAAFMKKNPIEPYLSIDTEILAEEITLKNTQLLDRLEPFGMGNTKPKFLLKNLTIAEARPVGKDQTHLQLQLSNGKQVFKGIAFQMAEHQQTLRDWKTVDLVCQLNRNEWNGKTSVDLQVVDARKRV
ncbi:MAG: single-stranded-DNA-specific exonuclease RecJ [bacterium]|nr:single-stranded-DNA-specific exonuclease RecJ [bacterium]